MVQLRVPNSIPVTVSNIIIFIITIIINISIIISSINIIIIIIISINIIIAGLVIVKTYLCCMNGYAPKFVQLRIESRNLASSVQFSVPNRIQLPVSMSIIIIIIIAGIAIGKTYLCCTVMPPILYS